MSIPPVVLANCMKVELIHNWSGGLAVNVLHFRYTGAGDDLADLASVGASMSAAWNTNVAPQLSTAISLTGVKLTDLKTLTSPQVTVTASHAGTFDGSSVTANSAATVSLHTTRRYRGGHGRIYQPGCPDSQTATIRTWVDAWREALEDAWENVRTAMQGLTTAHYGACNLSILHSRMQVTPHTDPATYLDPFQDDVDTLSVDDGIDSQRRRMGKL